jgi:hypothetical protein
LHQLPHEIGTVQITRGFSCYDVVLHGIMNLDVLV